MHDIHNVVLLSPCSQYRFDKHNKMKIRLERHLNGPSSHRAYRHTNLIHKSALQKSRFKSQKIKLLLASKLSYTRGHRKLPSIAPTSFHFLSRVQLYTFLRLPSNSIYKMLLVIPFAKLFRCFELAEIGPRQLAGNTVAG